jgi:Fe-S cluster biogenesis protein NfuA
MTGEISLSFEGKGDETIRITASPSMMHPEQCTFYVSMPLYPNNSAHFPNREAGKGSPLVESLFAIDHVAECTVSDATVRVTLTGGNADWEEVIPRVGISIRDAILSDQDAIAPAVTESQLPPEQLRERVQKVLDTVINPAVAQHGGVVDLIDVTNNTVYLEFGGGCQGCGMINVTLKYGVERTIREEVPEVGEILDSTDHAAGRNPYYAPSSK